MRKGLSIELATALYALTYLPYVVLTRMMATTDDPALGRPLTGLEILPGMLIVAALLTLVFFAVSGWARDVHRVRVAGLSIPFATRWTFWSGVFTALILVTVPLSYTFTNVSIPFMQLLMRGDVLIIAPLVDLLGGRRVRWWSWTALVLVAFAIVIAFQARDGIGIPPVAIVTIILYTIGYFGRLFIMTRRAKSEERGTLQRYFSEEKIVGFPVTLFVLGLIAAAGGATQSAELYWGFVHVWTSSQFPFVFLTGVAVCLTGVLSSIILLDHRENSFCVPLERSASILAGIAGSIILALAFGVRSPAMAEYLGAVILIVALIVLSVAPRRAARRETEARVAAEAVT